MCELLGNLRTGRKLMGPATATCLTPWSSRCWSQIQVGSSAAYVRPKTTPLMMLPMQWRNPGTKSTPPTPPTPVDTWHSSPWTVSQNWGVNWNLFLKNEIFCFFLEVRGQIPGRRPWHGTPWQRRLDVRPCPVVSWRSWRSDGAPATTRLRRKSILQNQFQFNF